MTTPQEPGAPEPEIHPSGDPDPIPAPTPEVPTPEVPAPDNPEIPAG